MDPKDFPYERFKQFKTEKNAALIRYFSSPTIEDIPIVVQPPNDIWGAVSGDRVRSLEHQLDALALSMQMHSDFIFSYLEPWHGVGVYMPTSLDAQSTGMISMLHKHYHASTSWMN
jgi:hypothetical protein